MKLQIDTTSLKKGRVVIDAKLTNHSTRALQFLPWNTPFDSSVSGRFLKVQKRAGNNELDIPYQGRMMKRAEAKASDTLTLDANSSHSNQLDITKSYSFCAGNRYTISFQGRFIDHNGTALKVKTSDTAFDSLNFVAECPK